MATTLAIAAIQIGVGLLLNYLFSPSGPTVEGPRRDTNAVSGSAYGEPWSIPYGTVRMKTNMIWNQDITEIKVKQEVGKGGFGGGATQVTYEYFGDFALGVCEGPIGKVLQIYADGKLLYDVVGTGKTINVYSGVEGAALSQVRATAILDSTMSSVSGELTAAGTNFADALESSALKDPTSLLGLPVRFYLGDEQQLPDPLIESVHGKGNVPAYRGLCYIVFEKLPLKNFGNRIPNIDVVIAKDADNSIIKLARTTIGSFAGGRFSFDRRRRRVMTLNTGGRSRFNYDTLTQEAFSTTAHSPVTTNITAITREGGWFLVDEPHAGSDYTLYKYDPVAFEETKRSQSTVSSPVNDIRALTVDNVKKAGIAVTYIFSSPNAGGVAIHQDRFAEYDDGGAVAVQAGLFYVVPSGMSSLVANGDFSQADAVGGPLMPNEQDGVMYHIQNWTNGAGIALWRYDPLPITVVPTELTPVVEATLVKVFPQNDAVNGFPADHCAIGFYVRGDNSLILQGGGKTIKFDLNTETIVAESTSLPSWGIGMSMSNITGNVFAYLSNPSGLNGTFYEVNVLNLAIIRTTPQSTVEGQSFASDNIFDEETYSILSNSNGGLTRYFLNRGAGNAQSLAVIVQDLCLRSGLLPGEIDVTGLTSVLVKGFTANRQATTRSHIEALQQAFFFDGIEEDKKLVFKLRGQAPVRSLSLDDLGELRDEEGLPDPTSGRIVGQRLQETEVPRRVTVQFYDEDRAYQAGSAHAQRPINPVSVVNSKEEQTFDLPIVFNLTEGKQIAEKWRDALWSGRTAYRTKSHWGHIDLSVGDVVTLPLTIGERVARITSIDIGANLFMDLNLQAEDQEAFSPIALAADGYGFRPQTLLNSSLTQLFLLDIPLLRTVDDPNGQFNRSYFAMNGYSANWPGGVLYKSIDNGLNFAEVGSSFEAVPWGVVTSALGDHPRGDHNYWDDTNTITFFPQSGSDEFESRTDLEVLNLGNAILLGNELIQFGIVVENADTSLTLSHLLRGRLGTNIYMGSHGDAERLIMIRGEFIRSHELPLSQLNNPLGYRGVTVSHLIDTADTETFIYTGSALKPLAPVLLKGVRAGSNLTISWRRRTRFNRPELIGVAPLNEAFERYSLEFRQNGSLLRTETINSATSFVYSVTNFTNDTGLGAGGYLCDNPGFESGDLTGWTPTGGTAPWKVATSNGLISAAHSGTYFAVSDENLVTTHTLSQTKHLINDWHFNIEDLRQEPSFDIRLWTAKPAAGPDTYEFQAIWLTEADSILQTDTTGAYNQTADGSWAEQQLTGTVPKGARKVKLNLIVVGGVAGADNAGVDDLSVTIGTSVPHIEATVYQVSDAVGNGFGRTEDI